MERNRSFLRGFRIKAASLYNQKNLVALGKAIEKADEHRRHLEREGDKKEARRWWYCINKADGWLQELERHFWGDAADDP